MAAALNPLNVFVSSRMGELKDLRAIVKKALDEHRIQAFVYELTQGAHPDDPERVSLDQVQQTDIFVLVIGDGYGAITELEYDRARELGKPCLVYERAGRMTTDPDLERFVKKLSGPRGVPSRKTFQNAVDLADQVATDVHDWLVREYRRLSAVHSTVQPSRRKAELEDSIQRLSATVSHSLPHGTPADLLAWQLQQWFQALEYPLTREVESHDGHTDLVIRVPARRRQFTSVLVRAKHGEIQTPDVEIALKEQPIGIDETWLVSTRRVTRSARDTARASKGRVSVYIFDELIEEDIDFESYFDWVDRQVQATNIDQLYVPLKITVSEIDAAGESRAESTYDDVAHYVDRWLEDTDGEHLSLLGQFGTGKSWFTLKYAHDAIRKYRAAQRYEAPRPRIPLVVRLREYSRGFKDVGALLTEFVFREHQINIRSFAALEALNRMGRLLFIFDGFDEMAARIDQQKMVDNFWALAAVLGPGSKAILTCRPEYFQFARQAREVLGGRLRSSGMPDILEAVRFQVGTLQMFSDDQLRQVLARRGADAALIESVLANHTLSDLARRPVMVDLLIEALPRLTPDAADLSQVYYQAVYRKMERDISLARTFTSMADKMFFMCEMSWNMLASQQLKVHYKQIPDVVRSYFGVPPGSIEEDHWRHDLLSQTMLIRDDDGYYRPAHKSLVEFFSAYKLVAEAGALKEDYLGAARSRAGVDSARSSERRSWSEYFRSVGGLESSAPLAAFSIEAPDRLAASWGHVGLNNALNELILSLSEKDGLANAIQYVSTRDNSLPVAAARMLEVLAFGDRVTAVELPGCAFDTCRLERLDMTRADLRRSTWSASQFRLVDLTRAQLDGASFSRCRFEDVIFKDAGLSGCRFDDCSFAVTIAGAAWCQRGHEQWLIAIARDGRVVAIAPDTGVVQSLYHELTAVGAKDFARSLAAFDGEVTVADFGAAVFSANGWVSGHEWLRKEFWGLFDVAFETATVAYGDVETLNITVTSKLTGERVAHFYIYDALDRQSSATRALCLARSGREIAAVTMDYKEKSSGAQIIGSGRSVELADFRGSDLNTTQDTIDNRGAAFGPDDRLVAICEEPNTIGFWRTGNGALIGRIVFHIDSRGATLRGTTGAPDAWSTSGDTSSCQFVTTANT